MHTSNLLKAVLVLTATFAAPSLVWAAATDSGYEEVSYDDLVNELNSKKTHLQKESRSDFDTVRLHAGIGYVNGFTNLAANSKNFSRYANGIQLSLGMDLFSPEWYAESVFRNYGTTESGTEELTIRDFDIKLGYTNKLEGIWNYTISSGLSNRFLKFNDPSQGVSVDETSPALVVSTGFTAQVHPRLSLGGELSARSAITSKTADKNSIDFAFRINTSL